MEHLLPTEEDERRMYERTEELLREAGYHRYEISNYAKEGYECQHNLGYWERKEYLGLGLGASSLIEETRFHNIDEMEEYLRDANNPILLRREQEKLDRQEQMEEFIFLGLRKIRGIQEEKFAEMFGEDIWDNPILLRREQEKLDRQEQMEEFIFLGLRKIRGIQEEKFAEMFGEDIWDCYGKNLERVIKEGLLEREEGVLRLTRKGIDVSNYVFYEILSDD